MALPVRKYFLLLSTLLILAFSASACTANADAALQNTIDDLVDLGFKLIAPSVVETEDGTRVHTMTLGPSNLFLIEADEGTVLVDAGIPGLDKIVLAYMRYVGIDGLDLIYITHAHPDHYGSAAALRRATGAPIAIHADDAEDMASGNFQLGTVRDWEWVSERTVPTVERILSQLEPTPPDILLQDGDRLDEYGIDADVVSAPGHTPGSTVLILEDRYAFVGDLASATGDPHAQSSYANDWDQVATSLQRIQALDPTLVFAGHGVEPMSGETFQALTPNFGDR